MLPATSAGNAKSNIPNCGPPSSAERLTTSRFVDVPILVAMPPTSVANPIGISTVAGELLFLMQTPIRIGSSRTTTGVLFTNADSAAPTSRVIRNANAAFFFQTRPSRLPRGTSAPVRTSPCPSTISAQTAINAS